MRISKSTSQLGNPGGRGGHVQGWGVLPGSPPSATTAWACGSHWLVMVDACFLLTSPCDQSDQGGRSQAVPWGNFLPQRPDHILNPETSARPSAGAGQRRSPRRPGLRARAPLPREAVSRRWPRLSDAVNDRRFRHRLPGSLCPPRVGRPCRLPRADGRHLAPVLSGPCLWLRVQPQETRRPQAQTCPWWPQV